MTTQRSRLGSFRHHLLLTSGLSTLVFVALVAASVFLPLGRALDLAEPASPFAAAIAQHFLDLHRTFWPIAAGALIASIASGLLLYKRMTGPLVRFRNVFRAVGGGGVPAELTIRRSDYLTEETDALNQMLASLRLQASDRVARATRCDVLVDELEGLEPGLGERGRELLGELREALKDIR